MNNAFDEIQRSFVWKLLLQQFDLGVGLFLLTTGEVDHHHQHASLDHVRVVQGDAFKEIVKLQGTFDFVFLDAWKPDYKKFFDLVFPRLDPGGLFVAHNVVNKKSEMGPFLETIHSHPSLFTTIVSPSGEGMSLSYRTR